MTVLPLFALVFVLLWWSNPALHLVPPRPHVATSTPHGKEVTTCP